MKQKKKIAVDYFLALYFVRCQHVLATLARPAKEGLRVKKPHRLKSQRESEVPMY